MIIVTRRMGRGWKMIATLVQMLNNKLDQLGMTLKQNKTSLNQIMLKKVKMQKVTLKMSPVVQVLIFSTGLSVSDVDYDLRRIDHMCNNEEIVHFVVVLGDGMYDRTDEMLQAIDCMYVSE